MRLVTRHLFSITILTCLFGCTDIKNNSSKKVDAGLGTNENAQIASGSFSSPPNSPSYTGAGYDDGNENSGSKDSGSADNSTTIETTACVQQSYYIDSDQDGFGDPDSLEFSCNPILGYVTNGDDCDDNSASCFPGSTETCDNGKDDNCDGSVDEGCPCEPGGVMTCGLAEGECSAGKQECVDGVWTSCSAASQKTEEICDNLDNDCDGETDELPDRQCGSTDVGACEFGTESCTNGIWVCSGAVEPSDEVCDEANTDEDCDGEFNEDCDGSEAEPEVEKACSSASCSGCCSNGKCVTSSDATCGINGGACVTCEANQRCDQGVCVCDAISCPNGCCNAQKQCQTPTSGAACGTAGSPCSVCSLKNATSNCVNGVCSVQSCAASWGDCDANDSNGCETDINRNATHCGGCGNDCDRTKPTNASRVSCTSGTCDYTCRTGYEGPDCQPVTCPSPPTFTHGRYVGGNTYGDTATAECDGSEYEFSGTRTVTCQSSGQWTSYVASCKLRAICGNGIKEGDEECDLQDPTCSGCEWALYSNCRGDFSCPSGYYCQTTTDTGNNQAPPGFYCTKYCDQFGYDTDCATSDSRYSNNAFCMGFCALLCNESTRCPSGTECRYPASNTDTGNCVYQ